MTDSYSRLNVDTGQAAFAADGHDLDLLIKEVTRLPVIVADNPLTAVVEGAGRVLDEMNLLKEIAAKF